MMIIIMSAERVRMRLKKPTMLAQEKKENLEDKLTKSRNDLIKCEPSLKLTLPRRKEKSINK